MAMNWRKDSLFSYRFKHSLTSCNHMNAISFQLISPPTMPKGHLNAIIDCVKGCRCMVVD